MKDNIRLINAFIGWRISLFLVAILSVLVITSFNASFPYFREVLISTGLPNWIWGFGNFDGVHYLRIAQFGYSAQYTQAFFPLYPILIKLFSFGGSSLLGALIVSNVSLLISLYLFYKLLTIDFNIDKSLKTILLFLAFPTAFYLGAVYSESTFMVLALLSFLMMRQKKFLMSGFFIALASLTRVFGICLILALIWEIYKSKDKSLDALGGLLVSVLGITAYMIYLWTNFHNPLYFLTAQPHFGAQRSASLVLLPQVLWRYLRIFATVSASSYTFFNAALEFIFTMAGLCLLVYSFWKVRFSYWIFSLTAFLLPTLTGTLSSMPRYSLMLFLLLPCLTNLKKIWLISLISLFIVFEVLLTGLFIRGYWVA